MSSESPACFGASNLPCSQQDVEQVEAYRDKDCNVSLRRPYCAVEGEPVRVSVCHCLECQRRTGIAFSVQARFLGTQPQPRGDSRRLKVKM